MFEDDSVTLGEHFNYTVPALTPANPALITNDRIGVEVELEGVPGLAIGGRGWATHTDGSLRNNGIEFVFNGPKNGTSAVNLLRALEAAVNSWSRSNGVSGPSISARTSVHVHVDVTDLNAQELATMCMVYSVFELPLFRAFAPNRINNHFCTQYNRCIDFIGLPRSLERGFDTFSNDYNTSGIGRYCAFNIKSIFKHGTIEFRHHPGEWREAPLLLWINACLAIKRAAKSGVNFRGMFFENCASGFEEHLRLIFPRDVAEHILASYANAPRGRERYNRDVIEGIRFVQNCVTPKLLHRAA